MNERAFRNPIWHTEKRYLTAVERVLLGEARERTGKHLMDGGLIGGLTEMQCRLFVLFSFEKATV